MFDTVDAYIELHLVFSLLSFPFVQFYQQAHVSM